MSIDIRQEHPDDTAAIRQVHLACFPTSGEADLVDRLRDDGDAIFSLAATVGGEIVGHLMLSRMMAPFRALGLAPVAVLPGHRRDGIAARLVREGTSRARRDGWQAIFVLGDPAYYKRFGFSTQTAKGFVSPYAGPHFMALALEAGLPPVSMDTRVDYAPAFSCLD